MGLDEKNKPMVFRPRRESWRCNWSFTNWTGVPRWQVSVQHAFQQISAGGIEKRRDACGKLIQKGKGVCCDGQ